MRRQTFGSTGRRGAVIAASAAVLCLGGALAACGARAGDGDGYAAVGAAGTGPEKAPKGAVAPSGRVTLIPLDGEGGGSADKEPEPGTSAASGDTGGMGGTGSGAGDRTSGGAQSSSGSGGTSAGTTGGTAGSAGSAGGTGSVGSTGGSGTGGSGTDGSGTDGTASGGTGDGSATPSTPSAPGSTAPAGPAALTLGAPERAAADHRWCEKVTVEFRNTGGSPARSGTVTFATHIIGGLGIDWATVETTAPLPAPIDAGAAREKTYTVCVNAWRVPLGMHVETRDITAVWK
ncbi:hypothetical protein OH809_20845 [Streptomyces sp. NBC_00873]|uniref:hypothetical protein n=1 Tax=unclassified Streptomyces TaxID=2593676 RepID=UPI003867CBE1|nr:hypothetical protein OH809_20845 [Streptomyces sp. NBC_00873]WTA45098.1 hypothetical protein OH821_22755 [Streptomyces sp. NBC_00842]